MNKSTIVKEAEAAVVSFADRNLRRNRRRKYDRLMVVDANEIGGIAKEGKFSVIISQAALNDYARINKSLTDMRGMLLPDGFLVGHLETSEQHYDRITRQHNFLAARVLIALSFVFERVLPKLLGMRQMIEKYGIIRHHRLTKCEALGRLRYCGYEIVKSEEIGDRLYFIARKYAASMNGEPCSGIVIKVQKVGYRGNVIDVYKLRTMHAYANYLHDYVLENLRIDNTGKVVKDFRVPSWSKPLRKLWLDEIPQIYNLLKGELAFIGPRHLSREFLDLYPEDWRTERNNIRPGLVPPYYADCPKTFEGIIESERRYCDLRKKHAITTDVYYLTRVLINFVTMRARTG